MCCIVQLCTVFSLLIGVLTSTVTLNCHLVPFWNTLIKAFRQNALSFVTQILMQECREPSQKIDF